MVRMWSAQVGFGLDREQVHLLHIFARCFAVDWHSIALELGGHAPCAMLGKFEIELVDTMLGRQFLR